MDYVIEVFDTAGLRVGTFREPPLLEVTRNGPDEADLIRGLAPIELPALGAGYRVRVTLDGARFCEGTVTWTGPAWGDTKKLVLDRYVNLHEVLAFEARGETRAGNTRVNRTYRNQRVSDMVKDAINRAPGPIHYTVQHTVYPEGAVREYAKFLGRHSVTEPLGMGGIDRGQWVEAGRIDASSAYAKDGNTIAGLVVDGTPWPDLRLMMVSVEAVELNDAAVALHPEVADWTTARYAASPYALRAEAARAFLQGLLDDDGVDFIELNPHRDEVGDFDGRVDGEGRYLGLVYGGGACFNAALVEQGHAEVCLLDDGRLLDPTLALKDFYSYRGPSENSVADSSHVLNSVDMRCGVLEGLALLAYAAGGWVFSVGPDGAVRFRPGDDVDRVIFHAPEQTSIRYGSDMGRLANTLTISGHPLAGVPASVHDRPASLAVYGEAPASLACFALGNGDDLGRLAAGLLDDLAYPAVDGAVTIFGGDASMAVGDLVELRGEGLRHWGPRLEDAWGGRFGDRFVGRVRSVTHRFAGRHVETDAVLTAPLRSVADPLHFLVRQQMAENLVYAMRLDDETAALDHSFHLD